MGELARGSVRDRPWGLTLGALGIRGLTGVLRLVTDDRWFSIAFEAGTVIDARSSLISDSMARIAMSTRLVTPEQVGEIVRKMAEQPSRDELDVVIEVAGLIEEKADRLRARAIAQRAARTFAVEDGEFVIHATEPSSPPTALDIRPIIYLGAMVNMQAHRLEAELARLGSKFELKPDAAAELPAYGLTPVEARVAETLAGGATIDELEATHIDLERHNLCAIVYSLVSGLACRIADPQIAIGRVDTKRVTSRVDPNTSFNVRTTPVQPIPAQPTPPPDTPIATFKTPAPAPTETLYDEIDLAPRSASKPAAPLRERAATDVDVPREAELRRTAARWAALELGASSPVELMRKTAQRWAVEPLADEGVAEIATAPADSPRPRSRTDQLLSFAAIEREPGLALEEEPTSAIDLDVARKREHPRAESWLPMLELSPDDLEEV